MKGDINPKETGSKSHKKEASQGPGRPLSFRMESAEGSQDNCETH